MATRAACANGNWLTSTTWATIDSTSFLNSESNNTALTTSYVESSTFTPGAITIDGIAVKIASRAASPTGTMSIRLAQGGSTVTGTEVTVNVSDVPTCTATSGSTTPVDTAEGGWFFVKFAAPVLLLAATAYTISGKTSSSSQVNLWRNATAANWSRFLRTTTTGSMASGDDAIITGEWTAAATVTTRTVTMDETATTDYGSNTTTQVTPALAICKNGVLTYGVSASTNYNLRLSGFLIVYNGGTYSEGASGAEMPRTSSGVLQFDCAADGDFGLVARNGSTVNAYGLSRTSGKDVSICKLNADASAGATSITLDTDTGWLNGDEICLAPTSQTASQFESKALTGNATATTAAITALTNAHSGTSPTQAELGLLTRNLRIESVSTLNMSFVFVGSGATFNASWASFRYLGTNATGKRGVDISTTTGTCNLSFCSVRDSDSTGIMISGSGANNITIQDTVVYNSNTQSVTNGSLCILNATTGTWTINRCMVCGAGSQGGIVLNDIGGTLTNTSISGAVSGSSGAGLILKETFVTGASNAPAANWTGLSIHTNGQTGILATTPFSGAIGGSIWRHTTSGVSLSMTVPQPPSQAFNLLNADIFGNTTQGILVAAGAIANIQIDGGNINGDSTFATTSAVGLGAAAAAFIKMYNNAFSVTGGIKTACTNDFGFSSSGATLVAVGNKSTLSSTNKFDGNVNAIGGPNVILAVQNYGAAANDNRAWVANGTTTPGLLQSDSGTVHGSDPLSQKCTPGSASVKLQSTPFYVPVASGATKNVGVYVQKNASYAGNQPRLILLRNDAMGISADTVCDTMSVGTGSWEQLTYTTGAAPQDGVLAFVVDGDGTAGAWFVSDISAS